MIALEPLDSAQFRLIGTDIGRVDVPLKVNGSAQYSIDVQVPGMIYGAILRQPVEGAAPEEIGDDAARRIPGVIGIVPLDYGVGVLADSPWAAIKGKNALETTWSRKATGWGHSSTQAFDAFSGIANDPARKGVEWEAKGDVRESLQRAARVFEREYRADYAYHAQMEPLNSVAAVSPAGDAVEVWCGTQSQTTAVAAVAKALDIPLGDVTRQYLAYVEQIRTSNLELASEYLLMAAMLIEIKSRMLLPPKKSADGEEPEDPRAELVRRLIEYEQMKLAAARLDALPLIGRDFLRAQVAVERVASSRAARRRPGRPARRLGRHRQARASSTSTT